VRVKVYAHDFLVTGLVHTKPGGYRDRVSDIVNDPGIRFLVLTDAAFRPIDDENAPARRSATLMVHLDDIRLLVPFEEDTESGRASTPSGSEDIKKW
jgi:hypothetical protein